MTSTSPRQSKKRKELPVHIEPSALSPERKRQRTGIPFFCTLTLTQILELAIIRASYDDSLPMELHPLSSGASDRGIFWTTTTDSNPQASPAPYSSNTSSCI